MSITIFKPAKNRFVMFCDFCGAAQDEAKILISSPNGAHICGPCALICAEIAAEKDREATA